MVSSAHARVSIGNQMFDWLQRPDGPPRWLPVIALVVAAVIAAALASGSLILVGIVAVIVAIVASAAAWRARDARREHSETSLD
jgi:hypothetical protein